MEVFLQQEELEMRVAHVDSTTFDLTDEQGETLVPEHSQQTETGSWWDTSGHTWSQTTQDRWSQSDDWQWQEWQEPRNPTFNLWGNQLQSQTYGSSSSSRHWTEQLTQKGKTKGKGKQRKGKGK